MFKKLILLPLVFSVAIKTMYKEDYKPQPTSFIKKVGFSLQRASFSTWSMFSDAMLGIGCLTVVTYFAPLLAAKISGDSFLEEKLRPQIFTIATPVIMNIIMQKRAEQVRATSSDVPNNSFLQGYLLGQQGVQALKINEIENLMHRTIAVNPRDMQTVRVLPQAVFGSTSRKQYNPSRLSVVSNETNDID